MAAKEKSKVVVWSLPRQSNSCNNTTYNSVIWRRESANNFDSNTSETVNTKRNEFYPPDNQDVCVNRGRFLCNPSAPEGVQLLEPMF